MLETIDRGDFLEFRWSGSLGLESLIALVREMNDACRGRGIRAALVDISDSEEVPTKLELHDHGRAMVTLWDATASIAVVGNERQAAAGRIDMPGAARGFWELVVQNQGIRTRVFTDRTKAEIWLRSALRDHPRS